VYQQKIWEMRIYFGSGDDQKKTMKREKGMNVDGVVTQTFEYKVTFFEIYAVPRLWFDEFSRKQ
jgi:hypothetical protein